MIYKDGKKVIPYKDDYQPIKSYKDGHLVSSAEKVSENGTSLVVDSEYKTPLVKKVNGNTDKVFDGNNYVYSLQGSSEVVKSDNLYSLNNFIFQPILSDIANNIWIRIWYIGTNLYNSPYHSVIRGKSSIIMSGETVTGSFLCIKTGNYNLQYGYDGNGLSTGSTNPIYLEEGKTYYAKFTYNITSENKIKFSNIIVSETDIAYTPYFPPFIKNAGLRNEIKISERSETWSGLTITTDINGIKIKGIFNGNTGDSLNVQCVNNLDMNSDEYTLFWFGSFNKGSGVVGLHAPYYNYCSPARINAMSTIQRAITNNSIALRIDSERGTEIDIECKPVVVRFKTNTPINIPADNRYHFLASDGTLISRDYPARLGDVIRTDGVDTIKAQRLTVTSSNLFNYDERSNGTVIRYQINGVSYKPKDADYWVAIKQVNNYSVSSLSRGGFVGSTDSFTDDRLSVDYNTTYNILALYVFFLGKTYSQVASMLDNNPFEFEYELATPQTLLNPSQILPDNLTFDVASTKEVVPMHHIESVEGIYFNGEKKTQLPSLNKVGTAKDYITWEKGGAMLHKEIGEVDLGTLDYTINSNRFYTRGLVGKIVNATRNFTCSIYTYNSDIWQSTGTNMTLAVGGQGELFIRNNNFTDVASFKTAMSGVKLIYELSTPTDTPLDIDSPLTAPNIETTLTADGGIIEAEWWEAR